MSDDEREAFESVVKKWPNYTDRTLARDGRAHDYYGNPVVQGAWEGFKLGIAHQARISLDKRQVREDNQGLGEPGRLSSAEPVAWMHPVSGAVVRASQKIPGVTLDDFEIPLYAHQRNAAEVSDDEMDRCERMLVDCTCLPDYSDRGRCDPSCMACQLGSEVIDTFRQMRDALQSLAIAPTNPEGSSSKVVDSNCRGMLGGWQSIETVPQGTLVLLCDLKSADVRNWAYTDWLVDGVCCGNKYKTPTHWMPLPAAPSVTESRLCT